MTDPTIVRSPADLARIIRDRRRALGQTQLSLATRIGAASQRVTEWESGQRRPTAATLLKLADALGYDLALIPREDT